MQSFHQFASELNRERHARARAAVPAWRHLAIRGTARRADPGESRMRRGAGHLPVAGRVPCLGVPVMLAAPLLARVPNAIAAAGPAPVVSAWNATGPDTAVAASLSGFPAGGSEDGQPGPGINPDSPMPLPGFTHADRRLDHYSSRSCKTWLAVGAAIDLARERAWATEG